MKHAIEVVPFGEYSDPPAVVKLAIAAEDSGGTASSPGTTSRLT
jgi:hypothetical protein